MEVLAGVVVMLTGMHGGTTVTVAARLVRRPQPFRTSTQ
jgi:hypothetical protein